MPANAIYNLPGFLANNLPANDDGSTTAIALPFPINFYGTSFNTCWVNNNGNITLGVTTGGIVTRGAPLGTYTPFGIATSTIPLIAPYFADFDTRFPSKNLVTYGTDTMADGRAVFGIDWVGIGYYGSGGPHVDKTVSCQLLLIDDSAVTGAAGDFSMEFCYNTVGWETGDASSGVHGLGGFSAHVGFSNGTKNPAQVFEFPGSGVPGSFLDAARGGLIRHHSGTGTMNGQYLFQVRSGNPTHKIIGTGGGGGGGGGILPTVPTGDLLGTVTALNAAGANTFGVFVGIDSGVSTSSASPLGAYQILQIPIGFYSVLFAECGFYPQMVPLTIVDSQVTTYNAVLAPLTAADTGNGFIAGWAVDSLLGTTLAGAVITATSTTSGGGTFAATADSNGGYSVMLPTDNYTLSIAQPGYALYTYPNTVAVAAPCATIVGGGGGTGGNGDVGVILGYTEDAITQASLPGSLVSLVEAPQFQYISRSDGGYELDFVPADTEYTVFGSHAGYRPRRSTCYLQNGDTDRIDLGLVPIGTAIGAIDGFVTDSATSLPISGAVVRIPGMTQAITTPTGYYLLDTIPTGAAAIQAIADSYTPVQALTTVVANVTTRVNIAMTAGSGTGSTFYGQVRDGVTGAGLSGVAVTAAGAAATSSVTSAVRGAYLITVPNPPSVYTLSGTFSGYYPASISAIPIDPDQSIEIDIGMTSLSTPVGNIHGYVFDASTVTGLGGSVVRDGRYYQAIAAFPQGEYLLFNVPANIVQAATATDYGYFPRTFGGVVPPLGGTLELDFPLTNYNALVTTSLTVTVLRAGDLLPLAGALVDCGAYGIPPQVTDATGKVTLTGLRAGVVLGVTAALAGYRVGIGTASLLTTGTNTLTILLRGFPDNYVGGQIYGHVTSSVAPPGQGIAGCLVSLNPDFYGGDTVTPAGGVYVIDNVPTAGSPTDSVIFDANDYDLYAATGVHPLFKTAVRVDAVLSPFDGRLPPGWRVLYSLLRATNSPVATVTVSLKETEAATDALRSVTQPFVTTANTTQLARYRRCKYDRDQPILPATASQYRFAIGIAPGTQIHGASAIAMPANPVPAKA